MYICRGRSITQNVSVFSTPAEIVALGTEAIVKRMNRKKINSIFSTNDFFNVHLISGESYLGRFEKDEQTGNLRLIGMRISISNLDNQRVKSI